MSPPLGIPESARIDALATNTTTRGSAEQPHAAKAILAGLGCLAVAIFCFSPHWWLFRLEAPGSFEWTRALSYLAQCASPFRTDVEPAMHWRFLPQLLVHALGGGRPLALAMPWLGAWMLASYLVYASQELGLSFREALMAAAGLSATSPILVSTGWLGINDAWVALVLCYAAFGRSLPAVFLATLAGAFVDERVIAGLPAAVMVRHWDLLSADSKKGLFSSVRLCLLLAAPYVFLRLVIGHFHPIPEASRFTVTPVEGFAMLVQSPLGVWMGMRFALLLLAARLASSWKSAPWASAWLLASALIPVTFGCAVASDSERTAGILLPLCVWGCVGSIRAHGRTLLILFALAMLLLPCAHVTGLKVETTNCLPIELIRLWR